jgi:lipoprotein-releasing system permease protein
MKGLSEPGACPFAALAPALRYDRRRMNWPYELQIGWRYARPGRSGQGGGFTSFISAVSMVGIALGVAVLIIVLSVMNGFQKEVRNRMLAVIAHIEISDVDGPGFAGWQAAMATVERDPDVTGAAPFVTAQALMGRGDILRGVVVRGIVPDQEARVSELVAKLPAATRQAISTGVGKVVLGVELARSLGVVAGDKVTVVLPGGRATAAGLLPRTRTLDVAGTFDAGHYEYDSTLAFVHLDDAAAMFQTGGPTGVQVRVRDMDDAPRVAARLERSLGPTAVVRDWTHTNRNWFASVQIQKRLMAIILTAIVAVAAFNLVSTLVMTVTDKRADIAILRTLGATPRSIMAIFIVQGAASGVIGTLAGVLTGLLVAFNIDVIVPAIESVLHVSFLPSSVYLISRMPSDPQQGDIVPIVVISLVLAFVATLYPSWRASRLQPAEALRYE